MSRSRPPITAVLDRFFAVEAGLVSGARLRCLERVERTLRTCLEVEGERVLEPRGRSLLQAERVLDPVDAFARTMHADDLAFALPLFLGERWRAADLLEARMQVHVAERLAGFLVDQRLIDPAALACALIELEVLAARVRGDLERVRTTTDRG